MQEKSARLAELNALLNIDRDRSSSQDAPEETKEASISFANLENNCVYWSYLLSHLSSIRSMSHFSMLHPA